MTAEVSQSVDSQDEGSVGVAGTSHEVDLTLDEETPQDTSATTHEQVHDIWAGHLCGISNSDCEFLD